MTDDFNKSTRPWTITNFVHSSGSPSWGWATGSSSCCSDALSEKGDLLGPIVLTIIWASTKGGLGVHPGRAQSCSISPYGSGGDGGTWTSCEMDALAQKLQAPCRVITDIRQLNCYAVLNSRLSCMSAQQGNMYSVQWMFLITSRHAW